MIRVIALILCAAGQLPAGCPTLPAGHAGSVAGPVMLPARHSGSIAGPWCCRSRSALRSRPLADVLRGRSTAGCPTLPAGHSGSVAGPVVLPVKIGPTLPAPCRRAPGQDRLPTCRAAGPTLPARGSIAGPRCCRRAARPVNSRPVAPRSRPVTRGALRPRGAAGQDRPHAPSPSGRIGRDMVPDRDAVARSSGW